MGLRMFEVGEGSVGGVTSVSEGSSDLVDHPEHYTRFPVEVIEITEHLNFNRGNAVKYLCRAGFKGEGTELVDLRKALWYVEREIGRVQKYDA